MGTWFGYGKLYVISIMIVTLFGCGGFKLRGAITIPSYLQTIYISPNDPYETMQSELRTRLKRYNVKIIDHPNSGAATLEISTPEFNEQILAYSSSMQPQRSKLIYSIKYKLSTPNAEFNRNLTTITRSREMSKSNNQLLTNETEEQIVKKELLTETINELLRQITNPPSKSAVSADSLTNDDNPC